MSQMKWDIALIVANAIGELEKASQDPVENFPNVKKLITVLDSWFPLTAEPHTELTADHCDRVLDFEYLAATVEILEIPTSKQQSGEIIRCFCERLDFLRKLKPDSESVLLEKAENFFRKILTEAMRPSSSLRWFTPPCSDSEKQA